MRKTLTLLVTFLLAVIFVVPGISYGQESYQNDGVETSPRPKTRAEKKILAVLDEMNESERHMQSVSEEDGRLLRLLTEALGAKLVVEIGTSHGYSALWFCSALQTTNGKLITHEIDPDRASLARKNFQKAAVDNIATLVVGDAHHEVNKLKGPIDIIFLDADKDGYIDYLNKLLPLVRPGGLILAHNTSSHDESMSNYLKAVTSDPNLETIFLLEDDAGIGVTLKKR